MPSKYPLNTKGKGVCFKSQKNTLNVKQNLFLMKLNGGGKPN